MWYGIDGYDIKHSIECLNLSLGKWNIINKIK